MRATQQVPNEERRYLMTATRFQSCATILAILLVTGGLSYCRAEDDGPPPVRGAEIVRKRFETLSRKVDDVTRDILTRSRDELQTIVDTIQADLQNLRTAKETATALDPALVADIEIFVKGAQWALDYETDGKPVSIALPVAALSQFNGRLKSLAAGESPWISRRGRVLRGYVSSVDGSVQPYGLIIPDGYDRAKPMRLDVVLHGSTKPQGSSELRFMEPFYESEKVPAKPIDQPYIELHPLGRVENCYRYAGETDVFEAIEDVCRKNNIDRDRIVLRGVSMGASGTWHLGLKHPDRFVALGPYCGYVDTHRFSDTPLDNFVRVGPLPEYQETGLHMLDSVDYAANAGIVPAVACMGEKDVFFQAHVIMGEAMKREGLTMVNIISPGTGHMRDPVTHAEQMRRIAEYAGKGIDHLPRKLRFVTWTLKYPRCHWLEIRGLGEHYRRAEISARILEDGTIEIDAPQNITRFAVLPIALPETGGKLRINKKEFSLASAREEGKPRGDVQFAERGGTWEVISAPSAVELARKRPGLTGPIDDAFGTKFLFVRGTGRPWNAKVQKYADASLKRFSYEWRRYFRGELPLKDDKDVTSDDVRTCNLILFGDPGSNSFIARVLPELPIRWTENELVADGGPHPAADHVPAFIYPNPLAAKAGADRYVVINSGHTFREAELAKLNYLLFPRWGDWAILKVGDKAPTDPSDPLDETVLKAGFFNEEWKFPAAARSR